MNSRNELRKNFNFVCKKNILVIIMILFLCPILGFSYSAFVTNSSSYRSNEMYIGNLLYSISIFEVPNTEYSGITYSLTNEVTLDPNTEKTIYIKVTSLNEVSSKYKLVYETEEGINVMYANDDNLPTYGLITAEQISTLLITNTGGSSKTVTFRVVGGYATNDVADITIDSEYSFISSDYHRLDFEVVALYIDGELSTALNNTKVYSLSTPTSNTTGNLISGSTNCTYGATPSYNTNTKTLSISSYDSITQGTTKCVLYFNEVDTLVNLILSNNTAYADNISSPYVTSSTGINFNAISSDTNGKGLYYTTDTSKTENGTRVYYYRGAVTNNYVIFGGFCWKIIRTNEDGSVKLFYWGTPTDNTCSTTATTASTLSNIMYNPKEEDNAYVGYMYGDTNNFGDAESSTQSSQFIGSVMTYYYGSSYTYDSSTNKYTLSGNTISGRWNSSTICTSTTCPVADSYQYTCKNINLSSTCSTLYIIKSWNSSTYANVTTRTYGTVSYNSAHENITNSTLKTAIDAWYQTNISNQGTSITNLIANTPYCNDRSITDTTYNLGYGLNDTNYAAYTRLYTNATPQYKCSQSNDKFTLSVASGGTSGYGNNSLTYPVGLITADEVAYAGGKYGTSNSTYYLYANTSYFTMSPMGFDSNSAGVLYVGASNNIGAFSVIGTGDAALTISISNTAISYTGNGTNTTPYIIKTN